MKQERSLYGRPRRIELDCRDNFRVRMILKAMRADDADDETPLDRAIALQLCKGDEITREDFFTHVKEKELSRTFQGALNCALNIRGKGQVKLAYLDGRPAACQFFRIPHFLDAEKQVPNRERGKRFARLEVPIYLIENAMDAPKPTLTDAVFNENRRLVFAHSCGMTKKGDWHGLRDLILAQVETDLRADGTVYAKQPVRAVLLPSMYWWWLRDNELDPIEQAFRPTILSVYEQQMKIRKDRGAERVFLAPGQRRAESKPRHQRGKPKPKSGQKARQAPAAAKTDEPTPPAAPNGLRAPLGEIAQSKKDKPRRPRRSKQPPAANA